MSKFSLTFILLLILFKVIYADYFKWEILVSEKGFGTEIYSIPISNEGEVNFLGKDINCKTKNFWTRIESELLLEGKTLVCKNGGNKREVSLICRDNNRYRKYNKFKELYTVSKFGFFLNHRLGSDSAYLELRCFF